MPKQNTILPKKLISLAKKSSLVPAGIICAHQKEVILSIKKAYKLKLIEPIFIGKKSKIEKISNELKWNISKFEIIDSDNENDSALIGSDLAKINKVRVLIKGDLHTDILMKSYLKKEYGLIKGKRLSHIWHITTSKNKNPLFITDGALNVNPRIDVKMQILYNVIQFAKNTGIKKPRVAILSGTEDPIESMPSSIEAKEMMIRASNENINAYIHGPLAFDNAVSVEAAKIKNIKNKVAGKADILLVPNLETGNSLCKMMVYFMNACAAGIVVGGKVPVVVPSRADNEISRVASIAASIVALN